MKLWFLQLESEFTTFRIRSDDVKFTTVVRHLDEKALATVAHLLEEPPETNKYQILKMALINQFSESEEMRINRLLAGVELGYRKPSDLLRELRSLSGGSVNDKVLQSLWLQPTRTKETLAVVDGVNLDKLAELADKIRERLTGPYVDEVTTKLEITENSLLRAEIAALTKQVERLFKAQKSKFSGRNKTRGRSSDRSKRQTGCNNKKDICYFYKRFVDKARKRTMPRSTSQAFPKHLQGNEDGPNQQRRRSRIGSATIASLSTTEKLLYTF